MSDHAISNAKAWLADIVEKVAAMEAAREEGDSDAEDNFREEIEQDAFSVQVRSGWYAPGDMDAFREQRAEEYEILLSTGGPALRIYGKLTHGQPDDYARLQWQDWGTPWTDYRETSTEENSALVSYARCYWFGE